MFNREKKISRAPGGDSHGCNNPNTSVPCWDHSRHKIHPRSDRICTVQTL